VVFPHPKGPENPRTVAGVKAATSFLAKSVKVFKSQKVVCGSISSVIVLKTVE
jgi:hypothetical protein